jgi:transposase
MQVLTQQGHTYANTANTAKTYLVNINAVNQWIARYKKDGIKGLNVKNLLFYHIYIFYF